MSLIYSSVISADVAGAWHAVTLSCRVFTELCLKKGALRFGGGLSILPNQQFVPYSVQWDELSPTAFTKKSLFLTKKRLVLETKYAIT